MAQQDPVLRVMPMPKDTNRYGTVFGGVILSYIDLAGVLEARKTAVMNYVTVAMNKVEFHQPVFVGDQVSFYTRTIRKGRTSITIEVDVRASRWDHPGEEVPVTSAEITYVAVDQDRKPVPIP
ncbi:MAG: acyl-CoA thioesterase [candidate division KSB1 bacterium]|nr:acyl-CoA thioesterase [candidate division KSB1 bacterium]MDZ7334244.1 acyl-CoA thioesterase [candidate division KSB1 bacterium]MDZ7356358.1 acyl-CoA thioesterase [candidate division KSB1 bacterium]MDZ7375443.1 acyl-CoA thioesterase [candidate division KSB1 bacterium]MDZ7401050.1 acyl-CoA thioesterase [candidate division KSB1 bacterium]